MKNSVTVLVFFSFTTWIQFALAQPASVESPDVKSPTSSAVRTDAPSLPSQSVTPDAPPVPSTPTQSASPATPSAVSPITPATLFSSDPGTFRSWFIDGTAALFGVLAVLFAIFTVVITVVGIITGISTYRDLLRRLESELREKVNKEFDKQLDSVVERQIEPKVKEIIESQLKATLETGKQRIEAEISRTIEEINLKQTLITEVANEIRTRLSAPQSPKVEPKEFDQ